jgi:hypothetical protein
VFDFDLFIPFPFPDLSIARATSNVSAAFRFADLHMPEDAKMMHQQEKRNDARHPCEGLITVMTTHSRSRQFDAGLLNYSVEGISFFSTRPLMPGTTIIVRASLENYQHIPADVDCPLRSMGLATIKWCQEGTRQGRPVHRMGAVYMMPD